MTDGNFSRRQVDQAIDRAVREMMQVDPRPGLRRRVLARVERDARTPRLFSAPGSRLRRVRGSWLLLPAAAVMALVVVAIVIPSMRHPRADSQNAAPPQAALPAPRDLPGRPAVPAPVAVIPERARAAASTPQRTSIFGERRDRVSAASVQRAPEGARPLPSAASASDEASPALPRIVMPPLMEVTEIRVRPIEIQAITLPALSPPR